MEKFAATVENDLAPGYPFAVSASEFISTSFLYESYIAISGTRDCLSSVRENYRIILEVSCFRLITGFGSSTDPRILTHDQLFRYNKALQFRNKFEKIIHLNSI